MIPPGKVVLALWVICLFPLLCFSQRFRYTAELGRVDTTGFYAIVITPQLSAHIKTDFADIRVADEKGHWVPHVLQPDQSGSGKGFFSEFPIIQNSITDKGYNLLIIENAKEQAIYNLYLFLKNAAVNRMAVVSGSDNQTDWYIIDDKISIHKSNETVKDEYFQEINFPPSKYHYFKIIINNLHNDPLLITKAGIYEGQIKEKPADLLDNPVPRFIQKDSNNQSYIEVRCDNSYQFNRISLVVKGPRFYRRDVEIGYPFFNRNNIAKSRIVIGNYRLLSALPATFDVPRTKASFFYIIIENADNPSLTVEKIFTQQQAVSLITYLEKGKQYHLEMGDSTAAPADYDLKAFKDSIASPHLLNVGEISEAGKSTLENNPDTNNQWIWPAIIIAVLALGYLTFRLVADIDKSKKQE